MSRSRSRTFRVGDDGVGLKAQVTTQTDPLNLRAAPVNGQVIASMPKGAIVDVADGPSPVAGWSYVTYNGISGYASDQYLTKFDPSSENPPNPVNTAPAPAPSRAISPSPAPGPVQPVAPKAAAALNTKTIAMAAGGLGLLGLLFWWAKKKARGY